MIVDKMTTNYCKVIMYACENKVVFQDKYLMPLMQKEIAQALGLTPQTVNAIFSELKEDGLIEHIDRKYYITQKAITMVEKIKELKEGNV